MVPGSSGGYDTNTSAHPAWYSSLWNYGGGASLAWNRSYRDRLQALVNLTEVSERARELTGPESGAYVHETNPVTPDWRESLWGPNYGPLLRVKKKYDPDVLMRCWKCAGLENSDMGGGGEAFGCQCQAMLQGHMKAIFSSSGDF